MAESVADQVQLGIVAEGSYGVDPATTRQLLRFTSHTLERLQATVTSQEITGDRQIVDLIQTDLNIAGDINFELSAEAFDLPFQGLLMSSSLGDNGTTLKSYTIEEQYLDQSTLSEIYTGCMFNGMTLNVAPASIVTGSFNVLGKTSVAGTGMTTPTAAATNTVLNAITNVTALTEGGSAVELVSMVLRVANNLRPRPLIGVLGPNSMALGQLNVSGSLRLYFEDNTMYNKFRNMTGSSLSISIRTSGDKGYKFDVYNLKYSKARKVAGGINTDIIVELEFQGLKKATSTYKTLSITALTA